MIRGGSWNNNPANLRVSNRNRNTPDNRNNNLGFRLVQSARTPHTARRGVHGRRGRGGGHPCVRVRAPQGGGRRKGCEGMQPAG
ncbi:MAG: SUMF1/EgtB/PvdO family nonheme iron enzyme [Gammaproteobacteria bacterium]